jgi:hypothetical protein
LPPLRGSFCASKVTVKGVQTVVGKRRHSSLTFIWGGIHDDAVLTRADVEVDFYPHTPASPQGKVIGEEDPEPAVSDRFSGK